MARYFFQLRDATSEVTDPEGAVLADLAAATARALTEARDILSHEMKAGELDLSYRIDVEDEQGSIVHTLPMGAAFHVIGGMAPASASAAGDGDEDVRGNP